MSTRRSVITIVEREGVNFLRSIVESANCIFHEIHRENDFGNDAIIEFVEGEQVRGICVAVQVKSGRSYCTSTHCSLPADRAHFEYWGGHSLPVIGVVYDPEERVAYWTSITAYLKDNPRAVTQGPYTISFRKTDISRLDATTITTLFVPSILRQPIVLEFAQSIDWARSNDFEKHSIGLISLMRGYRARTHTWDIFIELLREREAANTSSDLVSFLALIPGHMDIFWSSANRITAEVESHVRNILVELARSDVLKLLAFVDEFGIDRGTMGQNVVAIMNVVRDRRRILEDIALDQSISFGLRSKAVIVFMAIEHVGVAQLLSRLLESDDDMKRFVRQIIKNLNSVASYEM